MADGKSKAKLLLKISKDLTHEDLESMKFFCDYEEFIPKGELQSIDTVLKLFQKIGELDSTGRKGVDFIATLLKDIGKEQLHNKLLGIEDGSNVCFYSINLVSPRKIVESNFPECISNILLPL